MDFEEKIEGLWIGYCVTRQNRKNTRESNELSFKMQKPSRETSTFYVHHLKEFRETIYFSKNITITILTYSEGTNQQHLHGQFKGS